MKKRIIYMGIIAVIILAGVWILSRVTLKEEITRTAAVEIYENGVVTGQSNVLIDGVIHNHILRDRQYYDGDFRLEEFDKNSGTAHIEWWDFTGRDLQRVIFVERGPQSGTRLNIHYWLLVDKEMNDFAFGFNDGKIAATSKEMYDQYIQKGIMEMNEDD